MEVDELNNLQQKIFQIRIPNYKSLHTFDGVPPDFFPWKSNLSPSALYNCSLTCRKLAKLKTPEVKWISIKRWMTISPTGLTLPNGVFLSIKRKEDFKPFPTPHFDKKEFILIMLPYGNVWSQKAQNEPITEEWLWSEVNGKLVLDYLVKRDAAKPLPGYFKSCYDYMKENPDQIGIHLKRKRKS
jgi:hypothetical protein